MSLQFIVYQEKKSSTNLQPDFSHLPKTRGRLILLAYFSMVAGLVIIVYLLFILISYEAQIASLKKENQERVLSESTTNGSTEEKPGSRIPAIGFGKLLEGVKNGADPGLKINPSYFSQTVQTLGLTQTPRTIYPNFSLSIGTIGIDYALVTTNVDGTNSARYLPVLQKSVAHFSGTALPGDYGNSVLFGHSIIPILARGQYEAIFTQLPKVKKDDFITVEYGEEEYIYRVIQTKVVSPSDVSILNQPTSKKLLTLFTCIPPGFGSDRFVVIAELVE